MAEQLPLQFDLQNEMHFSSFFPGPNAETLEHLQRFIHDKQELQIYLWGDTGQGKTHLLQASCQAAHSIHRGAFYLNLTDCLEQSPTLLDGLETIELVCLDNIDAIAGHPDWETALFDFYNRHRDLENQLLIAADCPPRYLPCALPDLKTRMSWGLTLKLKALDDDQMIAAFQYKAQTLGIAISASVCRFLKQHYQRNLPGLWRLLDKIDQTTLTEKRKLSLAMLKRIIDHEPS